MTYTKQQIFNQCYSHLMEQNCRSVQNKLEGKDSGCAYRGEGGVKCAIGFLIPDSEYVEQMEGKSIGEAIEFSPTLAEIAKDVGHSFLNELQYIHDNNEVELWNVKLKDLACKTWINCPSSQLRNYAQS